MKSIALWLALVAAIAGCRDEREEVRAERRSEPTVELPPDDVPAAGRATAGPFVYADVSVTRAPVPARFTAPLPTDVAGFGDQADRHPPLSMVRAAVCGGDADMLAKLAAALRTAAARGPIDPALAQTYQGLFRYCYRNEPCNWLAGYLTSDAPRDARLALWPAVARCTAPEYAEVATHADAPASAVLDWYWEASMGTIFGRASRAPFSPRLVEVAREVAASGQPFEVRKIGMVFASLTDERAMPAFYQLYAATKDPERQATLAVGLGDRKERKAAKLFAAACKHPKVGADPLCDRRESAEAAPKQSIDERVAGYDADIAAWIEREPGKRAAMVAALERCVGAADNGGSTRAACLARLAGVDRARAVALAKQIDPKATSGERWWSGRLEASVAALRAYPEAGALQRQLAAWGMLPADAKPSADALTARAILEASGRVDSFDVETGMFPNEHDALLGELAAIAAPALDGAVFEEVPPRDFDGGVYRLHGYLDGKRFTVTAENLGDWYDVAAVLGLLNVMAEARGSDVRFVPLPTGDQTASILAGPRRGILEATRAGLLLLEAPGAGEEAGKAFEDQVFRQLQEQGKDVQRDVHIDGTSIDQIAR